MKVSDMKKLLTSKPKPKRIGLSTGSTLLNMANTGKPRVGFYAGHYYYLVGDSSSGKTFLALTCFAEACKNPNFDDYRLIFDNAEDGALMDFSRFFGSKMAERVEPPRKDKEDNPIYSETIEDLYYNLDDAKKIGKPIIYVLDSMDALSSDEEQKKFQEKKKAYRKKVDEGKVEKISGTYGDGKAKINSSGTRQIMSFLRKSKSIVIFISQTRDNFEKFSYEKNTRGGGRALTFYATLEMWSSQAGHIKKSYKDVEREQGIYSLVKVKKNRVNGRNRTVKIPIYHDFGIDDLGGCVDYLLLEKHWTKVKGKIKAKELDFVGNREQIIKHVEENELERDLQDLVAEVWNEIEAAISVERKSRYD